MKILNYLLLFMLISGVFALSSEQLSRSGTRFLLLTAMGDDNVDPTLVTAKAMLTAQGVPFDVVAVVPSKWAGKVSSPTSIVGHNLEDVNGEPIYTGIVLTSDQLAWQGSDGGWYSALEWGEWVWLWSWEAKHAVRSVSLYTWPSSNYGVINSGWGTTAPTSIHLTSAARQYIPSLPEGVSLPLEEWYYEADICTTCAGACACTAEPWAHYDNGKVAAAVRHVTWPGDREELMFFMVQSQWHSYSSILSHLWVNWITDMAFVGSRRVLLSTQIDDLLLSTELWDPSTHAEGTTAKRMSQGDLVFTKNVQDQVNTQLIPGSEFVVEFAFNGKGVMDRGGVTNIKDRLFKKCIALRDNFYWLTHTYSHLDMTTIKYQDPTECLGNAGLIGTPTTYEDNNCELGSNLPVADALLGAPCGSQFGDAAVQNSAACKSWSADSIVSPHISGTHHEPALRSMQEHGINNMVGDNSKPWLFPFAAQPGGWYWGIFTDVPTHGHTGTFIMPRGATNIFYNTHTPNQLVDMYNWIYEPELGYSNLGKILEREAVRVGKDLFDLKPQPHMFHQVNLKRFNLDSRSNHWEPYFNPIGGKASLLSLWLDAVTNEFSKFSKYVIKTLKQSDLAKNVQSRMQRDTCGGAVKFVHISQATTAATRLSVPIAMEVSASSGPCTLGVTGKKGLPLVDGAGNELPATDWSYEQYVSFEGTTWVNVPQSAATPITVPLDAPLSVLPVQVAEVSAACVDPANCVQGYEGEGINVPLIVHHPLVAAAKRSVAGLNFVAFADIGANSIELDVSGVLDGNYEVVIPIDITSVYPNTDISIRVLLDDGTAQTPISTSPVIVKILGPRPVSAAIEKPVLEMAVHKVWANSFVADEVEDSEDLAAAYKNPASVTASQKRFTLSQEDFVSMFSDVEVTEAIKACQTVVHHKQIGQTGEDTCVRAILILNDTRYAEVMPEPKSLPDAHPAYVLGEAIMAGAPAIGSPTDSGSGSSSFFNTTLGLTVTAVVSFFVGIALIAVVVVVVRRKGGNGQVRKSVVIEKGLDDITKADQKNIQRNSAVKLPTRRISTVVTAAK